MTDVVQPTPDAASDAIDLARLDGIMERFDEGPPKPRGPDGKFVARETTESEAPAEPVEAAEAEDAAPSDETEVSGEVEQEAEPEQPAIDPPASWTAEAKERFAKLPPDLQRYVAERESERDKGINSRLSEAAESRKKADAELQATAQERQRLAQTLQALSQYAQTMDPVLAEGSKTDWVKLAQEDPAVYVQKHAEYQQRVAVMQAVMAEQSRIAQQHYAESKAAHDKKLAELIPDFADAAKAKAKKDSYVPLLASIGYSAQEIEQGWGQLRDPREYVVLDRLAKAEAELATLKAEKKGLPGKKVPPVAAPTVRPKAVVEGTGRETAQIAALRKQADKSKRLDDRVNLVMAKLRG